MRAFRVLVVSLLAFSGSAVALLSAGTARAGTTCAQDSECVKGFTCQVTGATACADIACAPNQPCPAPPPCNPTVTKGCLPGPCNVDSDCATGMVCFSQTQTSCPTSPAPTCAPGAKCAAPDPDAGACITSTMKSCVPRYVLPCHVASDCGDGFSCVADQQCWCNGSAGQATPPGDAGTASSGGGSTPPSSAPSPAPGDDSGVSPPACGCTALDTSHCEAKMITCSAASDCPAMWACVQPPTTVSSGCASARFTDGGTAPPCVPPPPPPPPPSICEPPYYDLTSGGTFGAKGSDTSASAPPGANPQLAADAGGAGGANGGAANAATASGGGCQLGSSPAGAGGAGWLALIGLVGLARRRRSAAV